MKNCETFIQQSIIIHNNKYDYSLVEYIKASIKVKIICPIHGEFLQTPDKHKNTECGCPSCGYTKQKQTFLRNYGGYPQQNKEIREKTKQTNFKKYGVENISQSLLIKDKKISTCLTNYGVKYPGQSLEIQIKKKQTCLENNGVEYPGQSKKITNKRKETCLEKYGVESPLQNKEVQEKIKQTNLSRYGVENVFLNKEIKEKTKQIKLEILGVEYYKQQHMINILPLIENYDWLVNQYITQNKTAWQISKELKISDCTIGKYLKKHEIKIKETHQSYISKIWMEEIQKNENILIKYEYQFDKNNKRLKADGYCASNNTIYEFHGDCWHGNPEIFKPEELCHPKTKKITAGELYKNTIEKENLIKSLGYNLIVIWGSDYEPAFI